VGLLRATRDDDGVTATLVMRQPAAVRIASVLALSAFTIALAFGGLASGGVLAWLGPLAAVLTAFVTLRTWRLQAVVSPESLVIANLFRTHDLAWSEVDRVVGDGGVFVRLRSGREVAVSAFADVPGALPAVRRRNERAAKQLRAAVKRHRNR
jgi:hypothetical protein